MKRYGLLLVLTYLGGIFIFGCATMESKFKGATEKDDFDAYAEFLNTYGHATKLSVAERDLVKQARKRTMKLLKQANIKKLSVNFLDFDDSREVGRWKNYTGNMAMRDGYSFYEKKFRDFIVNTLENKGYLVKLGDRISRIVYRTKECKVDKIILAKDGETCLNYYFPAEAFLKPSIEQKVDAIFMFLISGVYYSIITESGTNPGSMNIAQTGHATVTNDISALRLSYHIFDAKSKKRIFAKGVDCVRKNNYYERLVKARERTYPGGKFSFMWNYLESEDDFYERCKRELLADLPENR